MERTYQCVHCKKAYTANRWNVHTARELANKYNGGHIEDILKIEDIILGDPDESCYYICPGCSETCYIDQNQIILQGRV